MKRTGDERVLDLLSDGRAHSHLEIYDLRVVGHSRVASLRSKGHNIRCERRDGLYWYVLDPQLQLQVAA